jgi:hypothetical protein
MQQASCSSISSGIPQTRKKKGWLANFATRLAVCRWQSQQLRDISTSQESNLVEYTETLKTSSNAWTAGAVGPVHHYQKNLEHVFDIAIKELSEIAREVPTACRAKQL